MPQNRSAMALPSRDVGARRGSVGQVDACEHLLLVTSYQVSMVHEAEAPKLMEAARALRPRILADRQCIESGRRLPEDLARELARAGFFRIYLPEAYGGLDLTPMAATEIFEELARADASVAWCVWNGNTYWTTVRWPKEVAH